MEPAKEGGGGSEGEGQCGWRGGYSRVPFGVQLTGPTDRLDMAHEGKGGMTGGPEVRSLSNWLGGDSAS